LGGRVEVEARKHAIAADVRVDDRSDSGVLEAPCQAGYAKLRSFRPSFHSHAPILGVDTDGDLPWKTCTSLADKRRIAHGYCAEDHACHAAAKPERDRIETTYAAAELNGDFHGRKNS